MYCPTVSNPSPETEGHTDACILPSTLYTAVSPRSLYQFLHKQVSSRQHRKQVSRSQCSLYRRQVETTQEACAAVLPCSHKQTPQEACAAVPMQSPIDSTGSMCRSLQQIAQEAGVAVTMQSPVDSTGITCSYVTMQSPVESPCSYVTWA